MPDGPTVPEDSSNLSPAFKKILESGKSGPVKPSELRLPTNTSPTQIQTETAVKDNTAAIKEIQIRRDQRLAARFSPPSAEESLKRVEELAKKLPPVKQ